MTCSVIKLADGTVAIVKHSNRTMRCGFCRASSTKLCDAVVGKTLGGEVITCDKPICDGCARRVGPNKDFCPKHVL